MPRIDELLPPPSQSVLDRLLVGVESDGTGASGRAAGLRRLRASVLRDLEWLLNTRVADPVPAAGGEAGTREDVGDVLAFGLEDITLLDLRNKRDQELLRRRVFDALVRFEPRLTEVRVLVDSDGELPGGTRFLVQAQLLVEPEAVDCPFQATVHWSTRQFSLSGGMA